MSKWLAILEAGANSQTSGGANIPYFSIENDGPQGFRRAAVERAGAGSCSYVGDGARALGTGEIKSVTERDPPVLQFQLHVQRDTASAPIGLPSSALCLTPDHALEVTSLPHSGRVWIASAKRALAEGDIILAADLEALQFLPFEGVSGTTGVFALQVQADDGSSLVINVTIVIGNEATGRPAGARRQQAPVLDPDPVAFGLLAALAAYLNVSSAAAQSAKAADSGASGDAPDNQARSGATSKTDDAPQDQAADGLLVTGSVRGKDAAGAQAAPIHRRPVGSSTPPLVSYDVDLLNDESVVGFVDQAPVQSPPPVVTFKDETPVFFGVAGPPDLPPPSFVAPQVVRNVAVTGPESPTPPVTIPTTAPPVARNDTGYLVLNGKTKIQANALLANDGAAPGSHLSVQGVSAAQHGTVTYDASSQEISFIATAGYRGTANFSYSVDDGQGGSAAATVTLFVAPDETLFSTGAQPTVDRVNDPNSVELGVRFVSASDGLIAGLRFYKGADNVGVHTASLWDSSGNLLATATFNGETSSGWQQVEFSNPVAIHAGVTYMASYHTNGLYSADAGYFASPVTNGDLTAIGSVYSYGPSSAFPVNSYNASNYWVDVVYSQPPAAPDAFDDNVGVISNSGSTSIASSLLLANDQSPDGLPFSITGAGSSLNGTVSYDNTTHAITFTPTSGYSGTAGFSYTVTDSFGASATADVSFWVAGPQPSTLFDAGAVPAVVKANDNNSVELGLKFQSTVDGDVVGLRFYKWADNTGPHVGNLWSATGNLLATATFTNETADGWQQVLFSTPVSLTAGVTYVASYHTGGNYSADPGYFASPQTSGLLTAPASTPGNANGLYAYGTSSLFPTNSFNATSYGVDVLFKAHLTA